MQPCPRQMQEATLAVQLAHTSHWREDGTCSYCGSLSPERFFAAIAQGARLTPTDKNYKVYVTVPNPVAGQRAIMGSTNAVESPDYGDWVKVTAENVATLPAGRLMARIGEWVLLGTEPLTIEAKFYFQHLSGDERQRFVDLMNGGGLTLATPGYFYRLPFFVVGGR